MSLLCQNNVASSFWCNDDIIITSCVLWDRWLRYWLVVWLVPSHYLNQWGHIIHLNKPQLNLNQKMKNFYRIKWNFFCKNDVHFMSALRCLFTCGVFAGWDEGMLTMRQGEVSLLTIEGFKGYGKRGFPAWGYPWWNEILSTATYIYEKFIEVWKKFYLKSKFSVVFVLL